MWTGPWAGAVGSAVPKRKSQEKPAEPVAVGSQVSNKDEGIDISPGSASVLSILVCSTFNFFNIGN